MDKYEQAIMDSKIETGQNEIRVIHNEMESKKIFWNKEIFTI